MAIDSAALIEGLRELRALAAKKLENEPLPRGSEANQRMLADIERHQLQPHIAELETQGYTVLPPGKSAPLELFERLRGAMERIAAETAQQSQLGNGSGLGSTLFHLLPRDRAFEEALLAPAPLTLVTYLLGYHAKLSQSTGLIKDKNAPALPLHADHSNKLAAPWSQVAQYCNVTWVLTEYTRANGAVCVWPGTHRFGHPVPDHLVMAHDHAEIKVLEMPVGSVVVWHGSLWHGAVPRTSEGRRMTLVFPHCRDHMQTQELYWATTTPEMIERNPARFSTLMGLHSVYPWLQDGPDPRQLASGATGRSQFE